MQFYKNSFIRFIIGILSIVFCIGLFRSIVGEFMRGDAVLQRTTSLKREEQRRSRLTASLIEATSSSFIEKQAREKLGLAREGETIILLDTSQISNSNEQIQSKPQSNWEKWWGVFF